MQTFERIALSCVLGLAVLSAYPSIVTSQERRGSTRKVEELTEAQFKALQDDDSVEVRGKLIAKKDMKATPRQRAEAQAKAEAARQQAEAELQQENVRLRQSDDARLEQENARVRGDSEALQRGERRGRGNAEIRAEAAQLRARAARATSEAELSEIQQRAQQLLEQLRDQ
jgi:hypothetical protein